MRISQRLKLQIRQFSLLQKPLEQLENSLRTIKRRRQGPAAPEADGFQLIRGGTVRIEVPDFLGTFALDAQSHLFKRVAKQGAFEPECVAAVRRTLRADRDAIDVGANVGFYSVLFGHLIGTNQRVLAIEPTPSALRFLHENRESNDLSSKIEVFEGAAGEIKGTLTMEFVPGREEYSARQILHPSVSDQARTRLNVQVDTLDALVESKGLDPGFIKMDVEGAELFALRGASATLSRARPHLLLEYSPLLLQANGQSGTELLQYLSELDYRVEWITDAELLAVPR